MQYSQKPQKGAQAGELCVGKQLCSNGCAANSGLAKMAGDQVLNCQLRPIESDSGVGAASRDGQDPAEG